MTRVQLNIHEKTSFYQINFNFRDSIMFVPTHQVRTAKIFRFFSRKKKKQKVRKMLTFYGNNSYPPEKYNFLEIIKTST